MSLKDKIQKIIQDLPAQVEILEAVVVAVNPLKIEIVGDSKRLIDSDLIVVAQHLTTYQVEVDLTTGASPKGEFEIDLKPLPEVWDGYFVRNVKLLKGTLTLYNGLKVGDKVICQSSRYAQRYYIIDRVG